MVAKFNPLVEESFPLESHPQEVLSNGGFPVVQVPGEDAFFTSEVIPDEAPSSPRHIIRIGHVITLEGDTPARLDVRMPPTHPWWRFVRFVTGSEFSPARASITPIAADEHSPGSDGGLQAKQ